MSIINDLNFLLNNLKSQFNNEAPIIDNLKVVRERQEYVLETDILSQEHLTKLAEKYHPDSLIISEELDNYQDIEQHSQSLVVMDPLDGTHNYFSGRPMWGLSYTVFSESQEPVGSYIGLPMLDTLLVYANEKVTLYSIASSEPIRIIDNIQTNTPLSEQMIAFDNQFYKDPVIMKKNYNLLIDNAFTTRISGSSVFDIGMLLVSRLNARIWHDTEIYDVAPAFAFFKDLGGILSLETGSPATLSDKRIICTTDVTLYDQLQRLGFNKGY